MAEIGYFNTEINEYFHLPVGDGHELYIETIGNPEGIPVVFLHGGPGGNINEKCHWFFNPEKYYVILFDQRGTGRSKPFLGLENNTPLATLEDIEVIREHFRIEKWVVFGGSYGSTLALLYGIHCPERCVHLVLRGIFLGRREDTDWLFQEGSGYFYPEEFVRFRDFIPEEEREDLVSAYYKRMISDDKELSEQACKHWADWENSILRIPENPIESEITPGDLSAGLLEAHYFAHHMFWKEDNYILNRTEKLKDIPIDVFHGRFDVDCRVKGAYELKQKLPHINLNIVQQGSHYPYDSPLFEELVKKMDELVEKY